ncbi:MAG: class I SAM-dependent methyltransferase [Geminicoccaceae bacterium]|nr:class I SAM-dependent methyltransferase [Geminicoccaceae bacterium]
MRIDACRACGSTHIETFLSLGDLPLSDGFVPTEKEAREASRYPLDVAFCHDCSLVQILHTVPPEELFGSDYPYFSSFTDTLLKHSRANVEARIAERQLDGSSFVIELASNDGYLLQYYRDAGIPHLGIDPAPGPVKAALDRGIDTRLAFFGLDYARSLAAEGIGADVIHGNNVLAHVADTNGFVAGIAALLKPGGVGVIEAPYVRDLIDHGEFDTIYHEHLCYFSVTALKALFARHGLYLNRVERLDIHGGSLRLFVEKTDAPTQSVLDLLAEEHELGIDGFGYYASFADRVNGIRAGLDEMLGAIKAKGASVGGYGAAAKGTILLNYFGIGQETLDFVADRNVHKQGRWIPGVSLPIVSPDVIEQHKPDYLLILPWNFKDEIIRQQSAHAERGGRFIIPIPEPHLK